MSMVDPVVGAARRANVAAGFVEKLASAEQHTFKALDDLISAHATGPVRGGAPKWEYAWHQAQQGRNEIQAALALEAPDVAREVAGKALDELTLAMRTTESVALGRKPDFKPALESLWQSLRHLNEAKTQWSTRSNVNLFAF